MSRKTGFTLLELIVVLFILTLVTALVAPTFNRSFGQAQLKAATRDLAALCRFARTQAIISQIVLEVVLDRRTNSYWLMQSEPIVGGLRDIDQSTTRRAMSSRFRTGSSCAYAPGRCNPQICYH